MNPTDLTYPQHARLDRLEKEDPGCRVIGWRDGPVIRKPNGALVRVVEYGRLAPVRKWP